MKALLTLASPDELQILEKPQIRLNGVNFDEDFLSALVAKHFTKQRWQVGHRISDAFEIYMRENPSSHRRKFQIVAHHAYRLFLSQLGDMALDELRHCHITQFRDCLLADGLHPNTVRRHITVLNAMVNMAFKHLDIDRLSPLRGLFIRGEGRTLADYCANYSRATYQSQSALA